MSDPYRAHRFQITKTDDGDFILFDPSGEFVSQGPIDQLAPKIMTGPEHYETCVTNWCAKPKASTTQAAKSLLSQLGLTIQPQPQMLKRRI